MFVSCLYTQTITTKYSGFSTLKNVANIRFFFVTNKFIFNCLLFKRRFNKTTLFHLFVLSCPFCS